MTDLYDVLGVDRHATTDAIKAAYRLRAKTDHPDGGGNQDSFGRINEAYLTLSDPAKRARYDETGNASNAPDNRRARAMSVAQNAIRHVVGVSSGFNAKYIDVIVKAREGLNQGLAELNRKVTDSLAEIERLEDLSSRFDASGDRNILREMFHADIANIKRNIDALKETRTDIVGAIEFLQDYRFRVEPRTQFRMTT